MTYDAINPNHYKGGRKFEPIEVIEDWGLNYHLGNALKYISRNGRKPGEDPREGLSKAIWYLERLQDRYLDEANKQALADCQIADEQEEIEFRELASIPNSILFGSDEEDSIPFTATHEDILEFEAWDPTLGPIEPEGFDVDDQLLDGWDDSAWEDWATRDDYKKREIRTLDRHKIAYTSKIDGWIYGHQQDGDVRILGQYGARAMGQEVEEPDNAPCEYEPLHDN